MDRPTDRLIDGRSHPLIELWLTTKKKWVAYTNEFTFWPIPMNLHFLRTWQAVFEPRALYVLLVKIPLEEGANFPVSKWGTPVRENAKTVD